MREECRLGMFENKVLGKIFETKRDKVTGEWKKLHNEDQYSSANIMRVIKLRRIKWTGYVTSMGKGEVHTPEGKKPLVRPRSRREDNIKMDLHEVGCRHGLD
jgi:hypothetical protein